MSERPGPDWADVVRAMTLVERCAMPITLRARSGPVREAALELLSPDRILRITAESDLAPLTSDVDLFASLSQGRTVHRTALAERMAGRTLIVGGAERLPPASAALLARLLDGEAPGGIVLLDEGIEAEGIGAMLDSRIGMRLDLTALSIRDLVADDELPSVGRIDEPMPALCCRLADALGIDGVGPALHALQVAHASANLVGRDPDEADMAFAARTVLAPRARRLPQDEPREDHAEAPCEEAGAHQGREATDERILEAAKSAIPPELALALADAAGLGGDRSGSALARRGAGPRGRPGPPRPGLPRREKRLDLAATLSAAAPWQGLRGRKSDAPLRIAKDDLRVRSAQPKQVAATIFSVDASGSQAMGRLAEVKGAIEQLLARSYVRRDEVALIAFRGEAAEMLLPPTRSLARAKRELAALPGGGPTPLAAGIEAGLAQALRSRSAGRAPLLLILTDGGANIARGGEKGRGAARDDAALAARSVAVSGVRAIVVDASRRGQEAVRDLANAMQARYIALPRLDDAALASIAAAAR